MTFKHKLSARMALLKDRWVLIPMIGLLACERPVQVTGPVSTDVVQLVVAPKSLTLFPDQTVQFVAAGLTAAGDTAPVQVNWSVTGGTIMDPGVSATEATGTGATVTVAPVPVASVALTPGSMMVPPVTLQFTWTGAVSPAAVRPAATNWTVWSGNSVRDFGATTSCTTSVDTGPVTCTGLSQARSPIMGISTQRSFSRAIRADSLCLNVMTPSPALRRL